MTDTFDWAGLAGSVVLANAGQGPDAAIAILQREIEAAFVPVETVATLRVENKRLTRALRSIAWSMNEAGPWAQAVAASSLPDTKADSDGDDGA